MRSLVKFLSVGLLICLFVVIGGQVILRSIGHSLVWAEQASVIGFCWLVFLGAAQACLDRDHLEVDLFYKAFKGRLGRHLGQIWEHGITGLQIFFLGVFLIGLAIMTEQTWNASVGSVTGFRYAWIYLGVGVGVTLCILALVRRVLGRDDRSTDRA